MHRSTERILTTHVGSLARPIELLDILRERENGRPYDADELDRQITAAVQDRVDRQVEAGIDIVTDGEMSKTSFLDYVKDRLAGFEIDDSGGRSMAPSWQAEYDMFPEYYEGYLQKYSKTVAPLRRIKCTGPISYAGHEAVQTDIANLKAAVEAHGDAITEVFMPASTPGAYGRNEHYADRDEYLAAIADAMREEYLAIVEAGFLLQIDDPGLIDTLADPATPLDERTRQANEMIDTSTTPCGTSPPTGSATTRATASITGPASPMCPCAMSLRTCCASGPAPTPSRWPTPVTSTSGASGRTSSSPMTGS